MEQAATAFVALHLAYALGAAKEQTPEFKLNGVNVGIPVAALSDERTVGTFDKIVRAATTLVPAAPNLTLEVVQNALTANRPGALPYTLHAELSGAIAGYCHAPRFYIGGQMIIDCGSATLDMASFDLDQRTNRPLGIYGACVENLGADACQSFIAHGVPLGECQDACRFEEHIVYRDTFGRNRSMFAQVDGSYPYQVILIGGGIDSAVHKPFLTRLEAAFARPFHRPAVASTLRYNHDCAPGRLILADGLARDPIDLKEVRLPPPPTPPSFNEPAFIGPEQV
jgi:hypothetical protein